MSARGARMRICKLIGFLAEESFRYKIVKIGIFEEVDDSTFRQAQPQSIEQGKDIQC